MTDILNGIDFNSIKNSIAQLVPLDIFVLLKIVLIIIVIYFISLIIKNFIQIRTAWRIKKISRNVEDINNKMDMLIQPQPIYEQQQ